MTRQRRAVQIAIRALVGLAVVAVGAGAVMLIEHTDLPSVAREPLAIQTDTTQNTERTLVCAGSFAELGADPERPEIAVPTNAPTVVRVGDAVETETLSRSEAGEGLPQVFRSPADQPLGAAQIQRVKTETLRGLAASACTEPMNEQWLVGGSTELGVTSTLSLGNPGEVPATVKITVFDENGPVKAGQTAGVLVPSGAEQTISLNGYAPDRKRIAVRVESTGAPVTASIGVAQVTGLEPYAVDTITRQVEPLPQLVIPGVTNVSDHERRAGDVGEADLFSVVVRVVAPGGETGTAQVAAIDSKGKRTALGQVDFSQSGVGELTVDYWPVGANAVVIEADVPVLAGVMGSAKKGSERDYAWFAPAPLIAAEAPIALPVVAGGKLIIANTGEVEATVEIVAGKTKPFEVKIPAGSASEQDVEVSAILTSSAPIAAGVRIVNDGDIAGYPVQAAEARDGELTVYPR